MSGRRRRRLDEDECCEECGEPDVVWILEDDTLLCETCAGAMDEFDPGTDYREGE